ncbi:MAG: Flp pilus assembly protein CpaB [Firmicutes bacterium]|nr:Flp pilus assembly protein CpaB [Bacillota bacterium]
MFRYRYLLVAIILALVGTRLTASHIRKLEQQATGQGPRAQVVVAKTAISKGTEMQANLVETKMWPVAMVPQGAIARQSEIEGQFASVDFVPGEVILADRLVAEGEQSLVWQLAPRERAIVVSVSNIGGLEAELTAGSRVDILGTLLDYGSGLEHSLMVLENIMLLDIIENHDPYGYGTDWAKQNVVLAVSPEQAKRLALFGSSGSLQLLLRPEGAQESCIQDQGAMTTRDILGHERGDLNAFAATLERETPDRSSPGVANIPLKTIEVIRGTAASLESASVTKTSSLQSIMAER